ncbi:recombinase family protein [Lysinibacillus telephonicus]|nr:recombinase family protein [Lysinibacillus telephonicus]
MKGVFYGRHSTDKQNMDTQLRSAYDFAEKYECEIIDEYLDEGVSSRKKVRKGLEHLIKDAKEKKFEFIVIYSHSRLARIPEEHDVLRLTMSVLGIHIVESSTETLYSYGDIVYSSIKDALVKYELDKIRASTRDSLKSLLQRGLWTGGKAPFGYKYHKKLRRTGKKDNQSTIDQISNEFSMDLATANSVQYGKFECIQDELVWVNKVFALYKRGYGFRQIADMMPEASYRGKNWDKEKVKQIIINPFYAGYMAIRKRNSTSGNTINKRNEWVMQKSPYIQPVITYREWEELFSSLRTEKGQKVSSKLF